MSWLGLFGSPVVGYAAAAAAVVAATTIGGQGVVIWHRGNVIEELQGDLQTEKTGRLADRTVAAELARQQEAKFRQTEQGWLTRTQEAQRDAESKIAVAQADAASAARAAVGLRDRLAAARAASRRTPSGAPLPAECAPAVAAADLHADVLERVGAAARAIAAHADASRAAGEACVAAWPMNTEDPT